MFKKTASSIGSKVTKYILLGTLLMLTLNISFYTFYSLQSKFTILEYKSQNYLTLLAESLLRFEGNGKEIFNSQKADIINSSKQIKSIDVYALDQKVGMQNDNHSGFYALLFDDEYHVSKSVYLPNNIQSVIINQSIASSSVGKSPGYIKLTIDLKSFRYTLLRNYIYLYIFCAILHMLFAAVLIYLFKKIHRPVFYMNKQAEDILKSKGTIKLQKNVGKILVKEYKLCQSALYDLVEKHNKLITDIEDKDAQIEQYEQSRKLVSNQRNNFQNLITGELKTSLNTMTGGIQLLGQQYLNQEQQDALTIVRRSNAQLNFMLEQISQLGKIENNEITRNFITFNPIQIISDLISVFEDRATKKGIDLSSNISHVDHVLEGDIEKIHTILYAILDNAIKYTNTGCVTVESSLQHFDETTRWIVKVIDTGIGIDKRYFDEVFTPFFQVDNEINSEHMGIGVGLSIAKQLIELIDAQIEISSDGKNGSSFQLYLTLFDKKQSVKRNRLKNISICCLQQSDSDVAIHGLEKYGANVLNAYDYNKLANDFKELSFEVLIININIDVNDILNLVKSVRKAETAKRTLIIWVAANQKKLDETQAFASGVDVVLPSCMAVDELTETISKWLN